MEETRSRELDAFLPPVMSNNPELREIQEVPEESPDLSQLKGLGIESLKPLIVDDPRMIDPNAPVQSTLAPDWGTFRHPRGHNGSIMYDRRTLRIRAWNGYTGYPIKLPGAFDRTPQPNVATCREPRGNDRGCSAWNGCPYKGHGPFNVIAYLKERPHVIHSFQCHHYWTGYTPQGHPVSQNPAVLNGWVIDTKRRVIPFTHVVPEKNPQTGMVEKIKWVGEREVLDLGPMYHATPPAKLRPNVRVGRVQLHEAMSKYFEIAKEEVSPVAGSQVAREGTEAQAGPGHGDAPRVRASRVAGAGRGKGKRKGRKRAPGRVPRVKPKGAASGRELPEEGRDGTPTVSGRKDGRGSRVSGR